ncbi:MAG: hypothetical protein K5984_02465, partial [Bacteroidales bacterium]|nr:hypothetical protein [Bacteroidales bacterium]
PAEITRNTTNRCMKKLVIPNDILFAKVQDALDNGSKVVIPIKGYSMRPFLVGNKDLVELEKTDKAEVDDMVLFRYQGRYVLHRCIAIEDGKTIIQGDGVCGNKEFCPPGEIIAKVTKVLKKGNRETDPYSEKMLRKVHIWRKLAPIRPWLLLLIVRIPRKLKKIIGIYED